MKFLIDSDWIIDGLIGRPTAVQTIAALGSYGASVSIAAVGEVFEGAFGTFDPQKTLQIFREYLADFVVLPLTDPIMETFARIRSFLRAQGLLIPDIDLQIAATAITLDLTLVTRNLRHFSRVPGLKIYDPASAT
ncbi:MAG TPA: type II toxin-antitoxin system VapC family toxin [Thermomicrobiales bacterium]